MTDTSTLRRLLIAPEDPGTAPDDWTVADACARRAGLEVVLRERSGDAPHDLRAGWERTFRETEGGNLLRIQALNELAGRLAAETLPWLPLKGMDLLRSGIYASPGERPMKDVDILVPALRMEAACRVLLDLGYRERDRHPGQRAFTRGPVAIELHDLLYPPPLPETRPETGVWERAIPVPSMEGEHTLAPEDRITYLCLHYYLEEVRRVRSWGLLRDLAAALARGPEVDWDALRRRTGKEKTNLFLSHRLSELRIILGNTATVPGGIPWPEARAGWRKRTGFRLCEREALRRFEEDLPSETEPGIRFYLLYWVSLTQIPGILAGATTRKGGGIIGRMNRLRRRFLMGK